MSIKQLLKYLTTSLSRKDVGSLNFLQNALSFSKLGIEIVSMPKPLACIMFSQLKYVHLPDPN